MKQLLFIASLGVTVVSSVFASNVKTNIGSFTLKQLALPNTIKTVTLNEGVPTHVTTQTTGTSPTDGPITKESVTTTTSGAFVE